MSQVETRTCDGIEWRQGQWVKFSRRMPRARFLEFLRLSAQLEEAQGVDTQTAQDIAAYSDKLSATIVALYPLLCAQIVAWNWLDLSDPEAENPPVMPRPTPAILDELSMMDETLWLVTALSEVVFPSKN